MQKSKAREARNFSKLWNPKHITTEARATVFFNMTNLFR